MAIEWFIKSEAPVGWKELFDAWAGLLDRYETVGQDVVYWHHEPAITSLLVTAAWKSNGAAIAEFSTERRRPGEQGTGAGDAWILVHNRWYAVEAKKCDSVDVITGQLQLAVADLWSLPERDRADAGLALCYCVPCRLTSVTVEQLAHHAAQLPDIDFALAYTPKGAVPEWDGYKYPGMITAGRFVDWSTGHDPWAQTRGTDLR